MTTKCCFAYPSQDDATEASLCLHEMANGTQPFDAACATHCGWVLQGYLNSQAAPAPCPCDAATAKKLAAATQPCADVKAGKASKQAINWLQVFQQVLAILLSLIPVPVPSPKP